jgi:hypothetical protein
MSELIVHLAGRRAGRLIRKDNGNLQFRYDEGYGGPPVSQSMPLQAEAHTHAGEASQCDGDGDLRADRGAGRLTQPATTPSAGSPPGRRSQGRWRRRAERIARVAGERLSV